MTNQVAISVIIPCFNAEKFIKNCLDDLHNQNFEKDIEIIIIDDASVLSSDASSIIILK